MSTPGDIGPRHWAVLVAVHLLVGVVSFLGGINLLLHHAWLGAAFAWVATVATAVSFFGRRGERRRARSS